MTDLDWSTPEGLAAIKAHLAAQVEGWSDPVAHAVAISPASSEPVWEVPHVNSGGGALSALVLATVLGHDGSTATLPLDSAHLRAALESLEPAEACPGLSHPNLAAWRSVLDALAANPAREAVAVFVASLDDPVTSDVDAQLRAEVDGLHVAG